MDSHEYSPSVEPVPEKHRKTIKTDENQEKWENRGETRRNRKQKEKMRRNWKKPEETEKKGNRNFKKNGKKGE